MLLRNTFETGKLALKAFKKTLNSFFRPSYFINHMSKDEARKILSLKSNEINDKNLIKQKYKKLYEMNRFCNKKTTFVQDRIQDAYNLLKNNQ